MQMRIWSSYVHDSTPRVIGAPRRTEHTATQADQRRSRAAQKHAVRAHLWCAHPNVQSFQASGVVGSES